MKPLDAKDGESFLGRWSRRKSESAEAEAVPAAQPPIVEPLEPAPPPVPLPDPATLTPASDFVPFMAKEVDPALRNVAMKQLFKDPHFHVMDGLDTYIDDYSTHAPMPLEMLRKLNQAKNLFLFEDEKTPEAPAENPLPPAEPPPPANGNKTP